MSTAIRFPRFSLEASPKPACESICESIYESIFSGNDLDTREERFARHRFQIDPERLARRNRMKFLDQDPLASASLFDDVELREDWAEARGRDPRRRIRLWIDPAYIFCKILTCLDY